MEDKQYNILIKHKYNTKGNIYWKFRGIDVRHLRGPSKDTRLLSAKCGCGCGYTRRMEYKKPLEFPFEKLIVEYILGLQDAQKAEHKGCKWPNFGSHGVKKGAKT